MTSKMKSLSHVVPYVRAHFFNEIILLVITHCSELCFLDAVKELTQV